MPAAKLADAALGSSFKNRRKAGGRNSELMFPGVVAAASACFFLVCYAIFVADPDYFERRLFAALPMESVDPITVGATKEVVADQPPMPAPSVVRVRDPKPSDYQIVTVFEEEAVLATATELMRVRVGSTLPGLGEIMAIDETADGVSVKGAQATLSSGNR